MEEKEERKWLKETKSIILDDEDERSAEMGTEMILNAKRKQELFYV